MAGRFEESRLEFSARSGRDTAAMEKTGDRISVYFADPDNGGDAYEITITLRCKAGTEH